MNIIECRQIIKILQDKNDPSDLELINFYKQKEIELLEMVNRKLRKYSVQVI